MFVFFVKQKTAYEMRISDWSSDVLLFRSAISRRQFPVPLRAGSRCRLLRADEQGAVVHQPLLRNAGVAPIGPRCRQAGAALQEQGEGRSRNRCDRRRPTGGAGGQGARFREADGSLLAAPALDLRTYWPQVV